MAYTCAFQGVSASVFCTMYRHVTWLNIHPSKLHETLLHSLLPRASLTQALRAKGHLYKREVTSNIGLPGPFSQAHKFDTGLVVSFYMYG